MVEIRFRALNNRALWYMGKKTNSPSLINTWLKVYNYLGLCKVNRNQKNIYQQDEFSYSKVLRLSNLFEIILATHITLRRLTSGTKLGLFNLMIKSLGTSMGFIVLIFAASGVVNKKNIIELLIYMPIWVLIEVSLTRMSLSVVNDKGLIEIIKIKHVNMCIGIFFSTGLEYLFTLLVTFPISLLIFSDYALSTYVEVIYVLPLSLFLILPIGLMISQKFHNQRDQKFLIPILLKGALVFTPFIPIIKGYNTFVTPIMHLNPFNFIFSLTSVNNLSYNLNVNFLTFIYAVCVVTCSVLYITIKGKTNAKLNNNTIEINFK